MSKRPRAFPMEVQVGSVVVKIYRVQNKGRASFVVSHYAGGKRYQKMFADFDDARADADSKATAISRGELDVLELRSVDRICYLQALENLKPTGVSLDAAVKEYAEIWRILGGKASPVEAAREYARRRMHELPKKPLPEAVDEMIQARTQDGTSQAYLKVLRVYLTGLKEAFQCPLESVSSVQLCDYFRAMEVSPRSKNNARATVGAFFKFCRERGWLPRDHEGVSLVPKFKEASHEISIFAPNEMAAFLHHARAEMVPFLAIGGFAGLRSAEIERLDWSEVRLGDRFIEVKAAKAKTASRRLVPISDNLAHWLKPYAQPAGRVVPFENMSKQIAWLVLDTNDGLRAAAGKGKRRDETEKPLRWKKNALRHSFISYRVAELQNVAQVALEAGNSPQVVFSNYRELVRPADAKAWFSIVPEAKKS